ncbi:TPA: hypothetical protein DCZ31_00060, partial [Patescibacteria group bacterium]|nr:hypothetical protein [Candidatus Gracilibacteria bacterium]
FNSLFFILSFSISTIFLSSSTSSIDFGFFDRIFSVSAQYQGQISMIFSHSKLIKEAILSNISSFTKKFCPKDFFGKILYL